MYKLTKRLETLLLMGVKQVGSYEPDYVFAYIGEELNGPETEAGYNFLHWVHEGITQNPKEYPGRRFGHGTLKQRFKEFQKAVKDGWVGGLHGN